MTLLGSALECLADSTEAWIDEDQSSMHLVFKADSYIGAVETNAPPMAGLSVANQPSAGERLHYKQPWKPIAPNG